MLKKRIIPCLDIKDGRTVKGVNFVGLRDAGDPVDLARRYVDEGADELVFLDITAGIEQRRTLTELVRRIAAEINLPFTVGGGVQSVEDAARLIEAGADKLSINSAAVRRPELLAELAARFGSQAVVLAIDAKRREDGSFGVFVKGGREDSGLDALAWAKQGQALGAGEILLTSMNQDGVQKGFDIPLTQALSAELNIPLIASGGAGQMADFAQVFQQTGASGALAATVFHFGQIAIPELKTYLKNLEIPVRCLA